MNAAELKEARDDFKTSAEYKRLVARAAKTAEVSNALVKVQEHLPGNLAREIHTELLGAVVSSWELAQARAELCRLRGAAR